MTRMPGRRWLYNRPSGGGGGGDSHIPNVSTSASSDRGPENSTRAHARVERVFNRLKHLLGIDSVMQPYDRRVAAWLGSRGICRWKT
jgi:hypothetical protein